MTIYVKTFYKKQHTDLDYIIEKAAKYSNNRLKHNYTEFKQDYIAASIVYDEKPIAFSLLRKRLFQWYGQSAYTFILSSANG